jgi:putative nucleotidyltransferase with HDIG domain
VARVRSDPFEYRAGRTVVRGLGGALAATVAGTGALLVVGAIRARRRRAAQLDRLVDELDERDPPTAAHTRRVAAMAELIAHALHLSHADVERVRVAALLHDVGKADPRFAPLLAKAGPLSAEEWALMRTHASVGADAVERATRVRDVIALRGVADAVRHHHERWDGGGYPDGLRGTEIPLEARIIGIADTLDAVTSDRPYQRGAGTETARAVLASLRGTRLDARLCDHVLAPELWDEIWKTAHAMQEARGPSRRQAGAGIAADDAAGVRSLLADLRAEYDRRRRLGLPLALDSWLLGDLPGRGAAAPEGPLPAPTEPDQGGDAAAGRRS